MGHICRATIYTRHAHACHAGKTPIWSCHCRFMDMTQAGHTATYRYANLYPAACGPSFVARPLPLHSVSRASHVGRCGHSVGVATLHADISCGPSRRSLGSGIAACHVAFARRDAPVMPHRNAPHCTTPHCVAMQCAALRCTAPHRAARHCDAPHRTALRCAATPLHCSGTNLTSSERIGAGNAGLHIIFFSNCAKLPVSFEVRSLATRARTRTHACVHVRSLCLPSC